MKLKPINEKILVRRFTKEQTEGGIYVPTTTTPDMEEGEIVDMGAGLIAANGTRVAPSVEVGDRVLYRTRGAQPVKSDGEELYLVVEQNIVGLALEA